MERSEGRAGCRTNFAMRAAVEGVVGGTCVRIGEVVMDDDGGICERVDGVVEGAVGVRIGEVVVDGGTCARWGEGFLASLPLVE
jgi:hypothetical protein